MDTVKGLNFAGHPLKMIQNLPKNLKILNISNCKLIEIPRIDNDCPNLKLLNVSYNQLTEIPLFYSITELYVSNNELKIFPTCNSLNLLDLSSNPIFELPATLSLPQLSILNIFKTPLNAQNDSSKIMKEIFPALITLNPENITNYSEYKKIINFWHIQQIPLAIRRKFNDDPTRNLAFDNKGKSLLLPNNNTAKMILRSISQKVTYVVTPENIKASATKKFGNPISAMMIKPDCKKPKINMNNCTNSLSSSNVKSMIRLKGRFSLGNDVICEPNKLKSSTNKKLSIKKKNKLSKTNKSSMMGFLTKRAPTIVTKINLYDKSRKSLTDRSSNKRK